MSIPAPGFDETATPIYGIREPKDSQKLTFVFRAIRRIAADVEAALQIFGLPPVVPVGPPVVAASAAARDLHWGVPANATQRLALQNQGATTIRTDLGVRERYLAARTDGGSNPGGAVVAGWYAEGGPREKSLPIVTGTINNGALLGTIAIPRLSAPQRVVLDIAGYIAPVGAAGNVGVVVTPGTGGTAIVNPSAVATVANGVIGAYARKSVFDIAAGPGSDVVLTLTLTVATTATQAQVGLTATALVLSGAQYT